VRIIQTISVGLPEYLLLDAGRMQQVIANLISNGIKFSPHSGDGIVSINVSATCASNEVDIEGVVWKEEDSSLDPPTAGLLESIVIIRDAPLPLEKIFAEVSKSTFDLVYTDGNSVDGEQLVQYCTVVVSVSDNGTGLKAEEIPLLFTPLQQLQAGLLSSSKGTGLGLAICQAIVSSHGGRVGAMSSPGQGCKILVAIRCPVLVKARTSPPREISPSTSVSSALDLAQGAVIRILVVDDVLSNRKLLQKSIQRNMQILKDSLSLDITFNVDTANDGHSAVASVLGVSESMVLESSSAGRAVSWTSSNYDVVTIDGQMPQMSGYVATALLRKSGYLGLVLGCTGNALEEDVRLFLSSGADKVFIKPIAAATIVKFISSRLLKSGSEVAD